VTATTAGAGPGATLRGDGAASLQLAGVVDFANVPALWKELAPLVERRHELTLSLAGVERINSAGLVLLLEALDHARRHGCRLTFTDLPEDLLALARMTRCESLFEA
jgi:phospholipid transport system transporter-binding protein